MQQCPRASTNVCLVLHRKDGQAPTMHLRITNAAHCTEQSYSNLFLQLKIGYLNSVFKNQAVLVKSVIPSFNAVTKYYSK